MLFNRGDKFNVRSGDLLIEIDNSLSGAQGIHRKHTEENHYDVLINGRKYFVPESLIVLLLEADLKDKIKEEGGIFSWIK